MAVLTVRTVRLKLRRPLRTAWGELRQREILSVRLGWGPEDYGVGEAAPLEPHDGICLPAVRAALDAYAEVLRDFSPHAPPAEMLAACAAERSLPQALAAIDLALWDRAGRAAGLPVAYLIAPAAPRAVYVSATIAASDPVFAAAEAYRAAAAGYRCVKVKVGVGYDAVRVAAVREAVGPGVAIRLEAASSWADPEVALELLHELVSAGIELAEVPVLDSTEAGEMRGDSPIPIVLDEAADASTSSHRDDEVICLRISRCGGITGLLAQAHAARARGAEVLVASSFDGPVGVAAGVHAAAVLRASGSLPACGLATLGMFENHAHILPVDNGQIEVPAEAGVLGTTTRTR